MSDETEPLATDATTRVLEVPDAPEPADPSAASAALPHPRTRWGAIVWGLVIIATAGTAIFVRTDHKRSADFADWLGGLTPQSIGLIAILALGVFVLVVAALSLVKRAQLARAHPPVG